MRDQLSLVLGHRREHPDEQHRILRDVDRDEP
jgi:hypothetical protein